MTRLLVACLALASALPIGGCSDAAEPSDPGSGATARPEEPLPVPRAEGPRTVVLVSLDTLRPDRLGLYGNTGGPLEVSPNLDAFAETDAVVFDQALAHSPWTLPSHMTMLTGLDPIAHNVKNASYELSKKIPTLAQLLQDAGFTTGAFTDGGYVIAKYGFARGFDTWDDQRDPDGQAANGFARLLPKALDWLEARQPQEDVFLFLHTFDTHAPFQNGDEDVIARFRERPTPDGPDDWGLTIVGHMYQQTKMKLDEYARFSDLLNDYDAGVFEVDRGVGRVLDTLEELGRYDDALVVVTSDHGESMFDHGLHVGHGIGLKDDELHVPLIVKYPGGLGGGTRHDELVGLVDVARTVLEVSGVEAPSTMQGESLAGLTRGIERTVDYVVGESQNIRAYFLVQNGFKYISPVGVMPDLIAKRHLGPWSPDCIRPGPGTEEYVIGSEDDPVATLTYDFVGDPLGMKDVLPDTEELYDRREDPGEEHDLAPGKPPVLGKMRQLFEGHHATSDDLFASEFFDPAATDASSTVDATAVRVLQALGYLDSGNTQQLREVPPAMRTWVLDPWVGPDTALLVRADRRVQRVRARVADGVELTDADRAALQQAGGEYLQWYEDHPHFRARMEWRVLDVLGIAQAHGFLLDTSAWSDSIPPGTWTRDTLVPDGAPESGGGAAESGGEDGPPGSGQ